MKAMIFAAGLGTRLKPLTNTIPKALLPLGGKTLLQRQIEQLRDAGIRDIVVNVHHFPDQIINCIRQHDGWGCRVTVSDERNRLLETGGGLYQAASLLTEGNNKEPILACNVDILSNINLKSLITAHQPDTLATLVVSERQTLRYLLFDKAGNLRGWTHTGTGEIRPSADVPAHKLQHLAFSGMQIIHPRLFDKAEALRKEKGDKFSLIDLYLSIIARPQPSDIIRAYIPQNYRMMDVGKIDQLDEAERFAKTLTESQENQ